MYTQTERDLFKQARQLGLCIGTLKNIEFRIDMFEHRGNHAFWLNSIKEQIVDTLKEVS